MPGMGWSSKNGWMGSVMLFHIRPQAASREEEAECRAAEVAAARAQVTRAAESQQAAMRDLDAAREVLELSGGERTRLMELVCQLASTQAVKLKVSACRSLSRRPATVDATDGMHIAVRHRKLKQKQTLIATPIRAHRRPGGLRSSKWPCSRPV